MKDAVPLSLDLTALREAYASGALMPSALIDDIGQRIERHGDAAVWIHRLSRDALLAHAHRVEARGLANQPLYGVPFAIKDNIDLAGAPTTAACPEFSYLPAESAPVVQRLIDAGAIPIGKTNLDQFATGLVGVRSPYGVPRNPFRADVIPGGSSSGSAVAVAAGLVSFALGTDTAGSGRVPAGLNNIVGLKPTRGALSTRGVVPACRSLDCVSIFTLTCGDAAQVAAVAEAFDAEDPFARQRPAFRTGASQRPPSRLRVGVPAASQLAFYGEAEAEALFQQNLSRAHSLGAELVEIDFTPFREVATLLYQGPWVAERWAALRSFHAQHADAFLPVTRRIVESAKQLSAADTFDGMYKLAALARRATAQWENMDVLLVPTAPRPYTLGEIAAEPIARNTELGTYTNFVNLLDLAAVAVPAGMRSDGIPWGVTFVGPTWSETQLLELSASWHASVGGKLGATPFMLPPPKAATAATKDQPTKTDGAATPATRGGASTSSAAVRLAVVGAHLSGLPLNHQLTAVKARLIGSGRTAPLYRLHALPNSVPAKPGLRRVTTGGVAIAIEVWELSPTAFGQFVAHVPAPMCIGTIMLETGEDVKGFLCEPIALDGAEDISAYGGWRAYLRR